ncbi:hypothetical protein QYE76_034818 [Lolium multiflorum]|uniref:Uncharacterized protein n=1 Tax=Lolium multiflorum TaxID=4521 RepID=A0AAD8VFG3_LOLMU|nr:hypothetical protein QYE76_037758 [Lolium multiflorum]KAK1611145.1 hypothetical protein QYE76_034818 [Lolium multiflorum]
MGSFARAARFLVLLQIALFLVFSAVIMSGSAAAARDISAGGGALNPNRPGCIGGSCPSPGGSYTRPCRYKYRCTPPAGGQP